MNSVLLGDCFKELKKIEPESIDLIYLDPPFFTQKNQKLKDKENKEYIFEDTWVNIEDYKEFIKNRIIECKRVLKKSGSIFLHCDKSASHYLRVVLDEVFKPQNFRSEIIWTYKRWSNAKKGLLNSHQNIYFYSKSSNYKFNHFYTDYSATTNIDQILQKRVRNKEGKSTYMKDVENNDVLDASKKGVPLSDVWDIPFLNPKAKERTGYPTQKPLLLLERIIKLVTDEGDTVLDPFCGSGTTLVASKILNRQFVGIDSSEEAVTLSKKRIEKPVKTESLLLKKGIEAYNNKSERELAILKLFDATPVQRNSGIDGLLKKHFNNKPISIKIQKKDESLNEAKEKLLKSSKTKKCDLMILVKTKEDEIAHSSNNLIVVDDFNLHLQKYFP
jgi:site-specific DNA-methyltransferase (adenine-specific)